MESLLEGKEQLQNRREKLYEDLRNAINRKKEIELKLDSKEADHDQLLSKNKELKAYIDKLSSVDELKNNGKGILEVGERQQRRKLKELKTSVERTLWFAETYGLSLNSARFSDQKGSNYTLSYCTDQEKKSFKDLPDEDQDKIKEILFIQDRFSISLPFSLPCYNTVTYGKHSIGFLGPSLWAKLTNKERNIETLSSFKNMIRKKDISAVVEGCGRDCYLCLS